MKRHCVAPLCTLCGHTIFRAAAHRGASSRPPGPVRTPAVREPMGDRAALERVVLELRGGRPPEGPALADMIVDEELDFEQLGQLTLPEIREVPPGVRMKVSFTVEYDRLSSRSLFSVHRRLTSPFIIVVVASSSRSSARRSGRTTCSAWRSSATCSD